MRKLGSLALVLLATGCGRPIPFVRTQAAADAHRAFRGSKWEVRALPAVEAQPRFQSVLAALPGGEAAFREAFARELGARLPANPGGGGPALRLSLDRLRLRVRSAPGGSIYSDPDFPSFQLSDTDYCVADLTFRVLDAEDRVLLGGEVRGESAKASWSRPDETRLRGALEHVRRRLAEYLAGSTSPRRVALPVSGNDLRDPQAFPPYWSLPFLVRPSPR